MKSDGTGSEPQATPRLEAHPSWVTDVLLIRHGQTDWNVEGRMQGHRPVELNPTGREQVETTAAALAHIQPGLIVSSPVLRAKQTAEILATEMGYDHEAIAQHAGFAEFEMGEWVGQTFGELWEDERFHAYWSDPSETVFPGGESMPGIQARAVDALNNIVAEHGGGSIIVTTHGGIVRLLLLAAMGLSRHHYFRFSARNASVTRIQLSPERRPKIHNVNFTPGLPRVPWKE